MCSAPVDWNSTGVPAGYNNRGSNPGPPSWEAIHCSPVSPVYIHTYFLKQKVEEDKRNAQVDVFGKKNTRRDIR